MKKNLLIFSAALVFLAGFVSAYSYGSYGSFGGTTLSDLLNSIDATTMILSSVFIVSFALLFFSLSKMMKPQKTIAGIISLVISLLFVYVLNKSNINLEELIYDMGITLESLHVIFPVFIILLVVIVLFFAIRKTIKKGRSELHSNSHSAGG